MEDLRVLWMRDRVYAGLGLQEEALFAELLERDGGQAERDLLAYLDQPSEQLPSSAVLFHTRKVLVDVEEDEEPERKSLPQSVHPNACISVAVESYIYTYVHTATVAVAVYS